MSLDVTKLNLFVVRNKLGHFFRAKGYSGSGTSWVTDINKSRVYATLGPARSIVTFFANNYPDYPTPEIIKINVAGFEVLDETERVAKAIAKKEREKLANEKRNAEWALKQAEKDLAEAQSKLNKLKKK